MVLDDVCDCVWWIRLEEKGLEFDLVFPLFLCSFVCSSDWFWDYVWFTNWFKVLCLRDWCLFVCFGNSFFGLMVLCSCFLCSLPLKSFSVSKILPICVSVFSFRCCSLSLLLCYCCYMKKNKILDWLELVRDLWDWIWNFWRFGEKVFTVICLIHGFAFFQVYQV